jgi:ribosomal protein S18 acetylase RimI-like enzyme
LPGAFSIRPCRPDECARVLEVWRRSETLPSVSDDIESVHRVVTEGPGTLLVAEADGAIIGTIIAGWDGWRGSIYRLAVVPEQQRRGVARALVEAAVRWQKAQGAPRAGAYTHLGEAHAIAFWRSLGTMGWDEATDHRRFVIDLRDA